MKKNWFVLIVVFLMVLVACGQMEEEQGGEALVDELKPIEVDLDIPETADVGEAVTFSSSVTQGEDLVDDASEVVYEIWLEGQKEQSEMIEADEQNGHAYLLTYTFEEAGLYHVQTHVTARGLHRMPTADIQVGDVERNEEEHPHENEQEQEHDHEADVAVDTSVEEDRIVIQIALEGSAYTGGNVTLELWQDGDEGRQWLDATEIGEGEYEVRNIEDFSGPYFVTVHIQDEEIHEHIDAELEFE